MQPNVLLCTDLDRTLIPNGSQMESPRARVLFRALAAHPEVTLAYVSGRHKELLLDAIRDYELPMPAFALCDVGTTIYRIQGGQWHPWEAWSEEIAPDWRGRGSADLARLLAGIEALRLQEPERQNRFKLSYYTAPYDDPEPLLDQLRARLSAAGVDAALIWSTDELKDCGLVDVLPRSANKLHAIEFLLQHGGFDPRRTVFAGDSGNDLAVLTSGVQAVLVHNASPEVRAQAQRLALANGHGDKLYLAQGGFKGMNGNYAAGILEGLVHYLPWAEDWL